MATSTEYTPQKKYNRKIFRRAQLCVKLSSFIDSVSDFIPPELWTKFFEGMNRFEVSTYNKCVADSLANELDLEDDEG